MQKRYKLTLFVGILLLLLVRPQFSQACDRSSVVLDSVVANGGTFSIYATLCVGGGVRGVDRGAAGDTRDIGFAFYTPGNVPINITFAPNTITGDTTGCTYAGTDANAFAGNPPFLAQGLIAYLDSVGCLRGYTCIGSQAVCGDIHTQCTQFTFNVDVMPDSIRVFGVEGAGNPIAGCFPAPDMLIDFTVFPVSWGGMTGRQQGTGNLLSWSTLNEVNNDYFAVQRLSPTGHFTDIGQVRGTGNSDREIAYSFYDPHPVPGFNHYRIHQVDLNGKSSHSETISVEYVPHRDLHFLSPHPQPTDGPLHLQYYSRHAQALNLQIIDLSGAQLLQQEYAAQAGENTLNLDLQHLASGVYLLRMDNGHSTIEQRLCIR